MSLLFPINIYQIQRINYLSTKEYLFFFGVRQTLVFSFFLAYLALHSYLSNYLGSVYVRCLQLTLHFLPTFLFLFCIGHVYLSFVYFNASCILFGTLRVTNSTPHKPGTIWLYIFVFIQIVLYGRVNNIDTNTFIFFYFSRHLDFRRHNACFNELHCNFQLSLLNNQQRQKWLKMDNNCYDSKNQTKKAMICSIIFLFLFFSVIPTQSHRLDYYYFAIFKRQLN